MKTKLKSIREQARERPAVVCVLLSLATLDIDFLVGREMHFPLLYVVPVALAAWVGKSDLAYALCFVLPWVRIVFENLWHIHESVPEEMVNAVIETLALALYVYFVKKQGGKARQMATTITAGNAEVKQFRAFTRLLGDTLQGRGISPGMADGVALVHLPEREPALDTRQIARESAETEAARIDDALASSVRELDEIRERYARERSKEEVALVETRLAMLKDRVWTRECKRRVLEDLVPAERAVDAEARHMEETLRGMKREFTQARSADIRDIGRQIIWKLATASTQASASLAALPPQTILVTEDLLLSDALKMDMDNVAGIVTDKTGPASHVAMLARMRNIPAVCDIKDATTLLASGDRLLLDAAAGTITVAPTQSQTELFTLRKARSINIAVPSAREAALPCVTKDGVVIGLHANIGRPDEAVLVLEHRLDGVGLFRSEYLFLHAEKPPGLEEQAAAYSEVAAMLNSRPVVIRTMDLGGDKIPRFGQTAHLLALRSGLRGLAFSLYEKEMFHDQITAIARSAARGNVKIMFPVVTDIADLMEACRLVREASESVNPGAALPIGAMIETPAAAFAISEILELVDFVSIGTNDLAHYVLAMHRGTAGMAGVAAFLQPAVLRATHQVVKASLDRNIPLTVCGEAAVDPDAARLLIGMGVRDLSVNPLLASRVRQGVRQITIDQAEVLARNALDAPTAREIQALFDDLAPSSAKEP